MKMYKKSDLTIIDGMLVTKDGDIVSVNPVIVAQANELETLSQKACYLADQPSATPMPSLDGFERVSINDKVTKDAQFKAATPMLDIEAARTLAMMDELDDVDTVKKANELLAQFSDLLGFVTTDYVVSGDYAWTDGFDTPTLGSVLELKREDITKVVAMASGLESDKDCESCDDTDCEHNPNSWDEKLVAVPATKENLRKLEEFLDAITNDGDTKDDGSEE